MNFLNFCRVGDVTKPKRANPLDAGIDFFVPNDFIETVLFHGDSILVPLGIKVDVPQGWALIFENKSGVATKRKLFVGACVIDHGYEGQVHLHLVNVGKDSCSIKPGEKIVQGVMYQVGTHQPLECDESMMWQDVVGDRGEGGFGSTGTH